MSPGQTPKPRAGRGGARPATTAGAPGVVDVSNQLRVVRGY